MLDTSDVDAERRHLTVMFCDLVDSTVLADRLDAEEFREVVREYQATCSTVVQRFEGYVAQHLGDGLMVYFGYPRAHEDDARRSALAGLGIVDALADLNRRLERTRDLRLSVRIGIHAGAVVAGAVGAGQNREQLALGQTPNIAARLQGIAAPDSVAVSEDVYRLIRGFFECEELGPQTLKGLSRPISVYRVIAATGLGSRFEVMEAEGLTPLVGRAEELEALIGQYDAVTRGQGRTTLVTGEAGIGKSRLVRKLRDEIDVKPRAWLTCRCSSYYQNSALLPIIELLSRLFLFRSGDTPEQRRTRMRQALEPYDVPLPEIMPIFADLLSVPLEGDYAPLGMDPQRQKRRTFELLLTLLNKTAERFPIVFVVEDIHWVDPSTMEFLNLLVQQSPSWPIFTVITARPTFAPPWEEGPFLTHVTLDRLNNDEVEEMVAGVANRKSLPGQVIDAIVQRTDGVPVFVEELTKMVIESGMVRESDDRFELVGPLPNLSIPDTLQDSLLARLDRLAGVKDVALLGAVLGREFTYEMIHAVSPLAEDVLRLALEQLTEAQLFFVRGSPPEATYSFKHALIQNAAYDLLLKTTRQHYHEQIAEVLLTRFPDVVAVQPELMAHHFASAGRDADAIGYWHQAGKRAAQRSANLEAVGHLHRGLDLVDRQPASPARDAAELGLQITLGAALMAAKGYGAPEVRRAYARAQTLSEQMGDTPQAFLVTVGLWMFYVVRGDYAQALELGLRLLRLGEAGDDPVAVLLSNYTVGFTQFYRGELADARRHLEIATEVDVGDRDVSRANPTGDDPRVHALMFLSLTLWHLGYPDAARDRAERGLALARANGHPFGTAWALVLVSWLYQFRRDRAALAQTAREGVELSRDKGFVYLETLGNFLLGWDAGHRSEAEGGGAAAIDGMRRCFDGVRRMGAGMGQTLMLARLVETCLAHERYDEAGRLIDQANELLEQHPEQCWRSEFQRLRGELDLARHPGDPVAIRRAEAAVREALATARRQGARSLALRAAVVLARLSADHEDAADGPDILADVYGEFEEGFDTADLRAAGVALGRPTDTEAVR